MSDFAQLKRRLVHLEKLEESVMDDVAFISRGAGPVDPYTGVPSSSPVYEGKCRLITDYNTLDSQNEAVAGQTVQTDHYELRLPYRSATVLPGDAVRIESSNAHVPNRIFTVTKRLAQTIEVCQRFTVEQVGEASD